MAENAAKVAAGMSTAAAIAAALALFTRGAKAAGPGDGYELPKEIVDLIAAIAASADAVDDNTAELIRRLSALAIEVQGFPDNVDNIQTTRVVCTVAARAYQLPDIPVPNGMQLVIKAWPLNGNLIYVGEDQSAATNVARIHPLAASECVFYHVKNAKNIWVSAVVAGESVTLTCERPGGS